MKFEVDRSIHQGSYALAIKVRACIMQFLPVGQIACYFIDYCTAYLTNNNNNRDDDVTNI